MSKLIRSDGLHFVPIPYPTQLIGDYLPATLSHDDYPDLIASGETVDTVAVGAVLIAYNWPKSSSDRYRRVQRFVEAFFPKIAEFQKPPRHPKWREVNLAATLPGWTRFETAQAWLDTQRIDPPSAIAEKTVVSRGPAAAGSSAARSASAATPSPQQPNDAALFREFLRWRQSQGR